MALRRCATKGCLGTLPAKTGKHCPRCGGTEFQPRRRWGRRIFLSILLLAAIGITFLCIATTNSPRMTATPIPPERLPLIEAHDLATRMTIATAHDDAFAEIIHRALAQGDFEYACRLGEEITIYSNKDKSMMEIVEAALNAHHKNWAKHAAEQMVVASNRDEALKKIMDAASATTMP